MDIIPLVEIDSAKKYDKKANIATSKGSKIGTFSVNLVQNAQSNPKRLPTDTPPTFTYKNLTIESNACVAPNT